MVAVLISRQSLEVGALANAVAGVTRLDAEAAILGQAASSGRIAESRISIEVLGRRPPIASVTRLDAEAAIRAQTATTARTAISRASVEVGARVVKRAAVTRLDAEAAILAQTASTGKVRISRASVEVAARRGSSGPVEPLALAAGIEVFLHNWVTQATLNSSYSTDIATSPTSGAESRRGLTLKPERTLNLMWQVHGCDDEQRARLDRLLVMLRKLTNERIAVPLYMDQRELDASYTALNDTVFFNTTQGRFFVGARVVIVQLDMSGSYASHTFHLIEEIQNDRLVFTAAIGVTVPAGSLILPMIDCEVTLEARAKYVTARNAQVELSLQEVAGVSQLPPVKSDNPSNAQTFDDIPIFDYEPDWIQSIEKGRSRQGQKYHQGRTNRVYAAAERSREFHKMNLTGQRACDTPLREDIWRVVEFFDTRRGRLRTFWHVDQEQIWEMESIDGAGAFLGIHEFGDFTDFEAELEGEWIGLVMNDGTVYVREAVTVQQVLTVYRITVSPALPAGLDVNDVVRVSRARRNRFDKDELEERWVHTGLMGTTVELMETLEEKNVET